MIKKLLGIAGVFVLSLAVLAGCSKAPSADSDSAAQISPQDLKTLIVGFDASYPPYGFTNNKGEYVGFDLDLAKEVCKRNGWNFEAQNIDWDAKDTLLNSGAITCIWNGFTMNGREANYSFSKPYMKNAQVLVVKAGSGIANEEDLAGKTVVTQVDSAALEVLQGEKKDLAARFAKLDQISDYNTAFMELESGAVDAVACDLSIAQYQMAAKPGKYVMLEPALSEEEYAVGFKKGNTELADQVSKTLVDMYKDGTVAQIAEKYKSYGLNMENWLLK